MPKRGRPLKFGRPAQLLAVRLPEDVVQALNAVHLDPAWAIISLVEGAKGSALPQQEEQPVVELIRVGRQSLIVLDQAAVTSIPGVDMMPLSQGRAFLALAPGQGMSDLELAVNDRLLEQRLGTRERESLTTLAHQLREWRRSVDLVFRSRSIIVVEPALPSKRSSRKSPRPRRPPRQPRRRAT